MVLNTSRELLAVRPRAIQAAHVLAGTFGVRGAVRPQLARIDAFAPVPGRSPGGHPA